MKYLLRITLASLLIIPFLFAAPAWSQDQDDKEVKVKIVTEENGEKKVFERTYQSKEEMQNDPEFQELAKSEEVDVDMDIDIEDEKTVWVTKKSTGDKDKFKDVTINVESEGEGESIKVKKVIKDENGEEKVVEKTYDSWEALKADEEMGLLVKELDAEDGFEWKSDDDESHIIIKKKVKKGSDVDEDHEVEVTVEEEGGKVKKKIKKRIEITVEEEE